MFGRTGTVQMLGLPSSKQNFKVQSGFWLEDAYVMPRLPLWSLVRLIRRVCRSEPAVDQQLFVLVHCYRYLRSTNFLLVDCLWKLTVGRRCSPKKALKNLAVYNRTLRSLSRTRGHGGMSDGKEWYCMGEGGEVAEFGRD